MMKIDIYAHFMPERYLAECRRKVASSKYITHEADNPANFDLATRFRLMERYPDVLQILVLSLPPVEAIVSPKDAVELTKTANDELAELVARYPDRFAGAVACLPLNDLDATLTEIDRAVGQLGLKGAQIYTNICGEPLDLPKFRPLFQTMVKYDLPLWLHPHTVHKPVERMLGWPYETAAAMLRLVLSGIFTELPDLKVITHHCGSMVPYFEQRLRWLLPLRVHPEKVKDPLEHFRKFYNDTALYGSTPALKCAYDFFGAERLLFGTDMPLGPGFGLTEMTIRSIERLEVPEAEKEKIFFQNAVDLLRIPV